MIWRKSARSILAKLESRRNPALLTRISTRPHFSTVDETIASTAAKSVTELPSTRASPPLARISLAHWSAAAPELPAPSATVPRSFPTTLSRQEERRGGEKGVNDGII